MEKKKSLLNSRFEIEVKVDYHILALLCKSKLALLAIID